MGRCACGCGEEAQGRARYTDKKHAAKQRKRRQRERQQQQKLSAYLASIDPDATSAKIARGVAELAEVNRAIAEAHDSCGPSALDSLRERRRQLELKLGGGTRSTKRGPQHIPGLYDQRRREQIDLAAASAPDPTTQADDWRGRKAMSSRRFARVADIMQRNATIGTNLRRYNGPDWDDRDPWQAALKAIDCAIRDTADGRSHSSASGRRIYLGCRCRSCTRRRNLQATPLAEVRERRLVRRFDVRAVAA